MLSAKVAKRNMHFLYSINIVLILYINQNIYLNIYIYIYMCKDI